MHKNLLNDANKLSDLLQSIPLRRLGKPGGFGIGSRIFGGGRIGLCDGNDTVVAGGLSWNYVEQ